MAIIFRCPHDRTRLRTVDPLAGQSLRAAVLAVMLAAGGHAPADSPPADTGSPAKDEQKDLDTSGLERLNAFRRAADLPPVTLDPTLCRGCRGHAEYLARNYTRRCRLSARRARPPLGLPSAVSRPRTPWP
jgi:uncharacterized protein YkwD